MAKASSHEVTALLRAWSDGDRAALDELAPMVEAELHRLARRYMAGERAGHTLQTTALVNEAYLRLIDWNNVSWKNRAHFFGVSAQIMRRVLVDFARRRPHMKRPGDVHQISLAHALDLPQDPSRDLLALDEALQALEKLDPRKSRIVEFRFFGGLSVDETAAVMELAPITVMREWNKARAWLYNELTRSASAPEIKQE